MDDFNANAVRAIGPNLLVSISAWLESGEGLEKIHESVSKSQGAVKELNDARTVDPKILQEPVTLF
jgi:hypothetical protein